MAPPLSPKVNTSLYHSPPLKKNQPVLYDSLKTILHHTDANVRINMSQRIPSIRAVEKSVPLKIRYLSIKDTTVDINDVHYKLGIYRNSPNGYVPQFVQRENAHGGDSYDFDRFGFEIPNGSNPILPILHYQLRFLTFHSDYFSTLFSANFKEGQMNEIELKEVSYKDFALFLSIFSPNPQFPNDDTVEKLLELARQFQVPAVIRIVEHHLLITSKIEHGNMIWLADEYAMTKLLEKCIRQITSAEMAKQLKRSPEFKELSDKTNTLILRHLLEII